MQGRLLRCFSDVTLVLVVDDLSVVTVIKQLVEKLGVDNRQVISQPSIRYLGVMFDSAVGFMSHDDMCDKTAVTALARILPDAEAPIQSMKL